MTEDELRSIKTRTTILEDTPHFIVYAWDRAGDGIKYQGALRTPQEATEAATQMALDFPTHTIVVSRVMMSIARDPNAREPLVIGVPGRVG